MHSAAIPTSGGTLPLCRKIREDLAVKIRSGQWRVDEEIPSEAALCLRYGVSRGTIRQALAELVQQGLIYRRQGRGSFVQRPKLEGSVLGSYRLYMSRAPLDARSSSPIRRSIGSARVMSPHPPWNP